MAESKIEDVLVKYFDGMPKWLKNMTVIFIILGIVYFGFVRNYIYKNTNSNSIELLQEDVEKLEMKVNKLETQQLVNAQMMNEIVTLKNVAAEQTEFQLEQSEILKNNLLKSDDKEDEETLSRYDLTYKKNLQNIIDTNIKDKIKLSN